MKHYFTSDYPNHISSIQDCDSIQLYQPHFDQTLLFCIPGFAKTARHRLRTTYYQAEKADIPYTLNVLETAVADLYPDQVRFPHAPG